MYLKKMLLVICLLISIAGCGQSVEEEIFNHLENAVALEEAFVEQQAPLVELEKKEQQLYDKIIQLGITEVEQIKSLSKEALAVVNERAERLEKEQKSIQASKEEFMLVSSKVKEIDDEHLKAKGEHLLEVMKDRYDSYDMMYSNYKEALTLDRKLYEMFQNDKLTLLELQEQIAKINTSYEGVVKANDRFNELTRTYNETKKDFYKEANLNVVFK